MRFDAHVYMNCCLKGGYAVKSKTVGLFLILFGVCVLAACGGKELSQAKATTTPISEGEKAQEASQGEFDVEPNDEVGEASPVEPGRILGSLGNGDEADWFSLEVPQGHVLTISFTPQSGAEGMTIALYGPDQQEIWFQDGLQVGKTESVTQVMGNASGGTYYLRPAYGQGRYELEVSIQIQQDAGTESDAGGMVEGAISLEPGSYQGRQGDFDETDWYSFQVPDGYVLQLDVKAGQDGDGFAVSLRDPDREEVWFADGFSPGTEKSVHMLTGSSSGGTFWLDISYGQGMYEIHLNLKDQDDAGTGGDAGDDISNAPKIPVGQTCTGQIGDFDIMDWYRFDPEQSQTLRFTKGEESTDMIIVVKDHDKKEVFFKDGLDPGQTVTYQLSDVVGQPYYVQVAHGKGTYRFEIQE
jgi:hypothetical protein